MGKRRVMRKRIISIVLILLSKLRRHPNEGKGITNNDSSKKAAAKQVSCLRSGMPVDGITLNGLSVSTEETCRL